MSHTIAQPRWQKWTEQKRARHVPVYREGALHALTLMAKVFDRYKVEEVPGLSVDELMAAAAFLPHAPLWFVNEEMCNVLETAAASLPGDVSLHPELVDPHRKSGFVVFARSMDARAVVPSGLPNDQADPGDTLWTGAMLWHTAIYAHADEPGQDHRRVRSTTFADVGNIPAMGRWGVTGGGTWSVGQSLDQMNEKTAFGDEDARLLLALLTLADSKGFAEQITETADRAARRTAARRNLGDPDVTVVRLCRSYSSHDHGDSDGVSRYRHRWVVDGHWRSQPYGPGRTLRRPVWIAPHIKGPEGAPLSSAVKVRALVRKP